jgi:hypothetical protein
LVRDTRKIGAVCPSGDVHENSIHSDVGSLDRRLRNVRVGIRDAEVDPGPAKEKLACALSL